MIPTDKFYDYLVEKGIDSFYGVPDSLLKDVCAYITKNTSKDRHIITANEGNAIALASGKYIATGKPALVYMQNSGLGNAINPLISLADEAVYKIPMVLMIGWRGEPGKHDEPQHIKQGSVTLSLLETIGIKYLVLTENYKEDLDRIFDLLHSENKPVALIVRKGIFSNFTLEGTKNKYKLLREQALETIIHNTNDEDIIISTTGKTSREIFEIREKLNHKHDKDFLTVGSMGHTGSIALGISLYTDKNVYCIDGDGSMLMHLGSLGIIAKNAKSNYKYILINNGSHESVGGQPTIAFDIDINKLLSGLGFKEIITVDDVDSLKYALKKLEINTLTALVINTKQGSRSNLGRPTTTPQQNKDSLMEFIKRK
jgi:phosphonopyruvate decarboxylase